MEYKYLVIKNDIGIGDISEETISYILDSIRIHKRLLLCSRSKLYIEDETMNKTVQFDQVGNIFIDIIAMQEQFIYDHIKWVWRLPGLRYLAAKGVVLQYKPPTIEYHDDRVTIKQHMRLIGKSEICALIFLKRLETKDLNTTDDK